MKINMQSNNNQRVKKFYVYGHYTNDEDKIFYIGVGTISNFKSKKENVIYSRAYHFCNRTKFWKNIKSKHGVKVKILSLFFTKEESLNEEKRLISKYGRRLYNGILCNLSSGGEIGPIGCSKPMSEKQKRLLSEIKSTTLYVYDYKGVFLKEIKTIKETAKFCGVTYNAICSCLKTKNFSNNFFIFKDYKGLSLNTTKEDLIFKSTLSKAIITENLNTGDLKRHDSIADCSIFLKTCRKNLKIALKKERPCKKHKVYFERTISSQDPK